MVKARQPGITPKRVVIKTKFYICAYLDVMIRYLFLFILALFVFNVAFAQTDTAVYYLNNSGRVVSTKDSADFFLVVLPPDTTFDSKLFVVKEFYTNGKLKLISGSTGNSLENLEFQGPYVAFYPNGHKKAGQELQKKFASWRRN